MCRFYNAGSSEEFGNVIYEPQDEKHPLRPRSPYGASKAAARQLIKVYRESYSLYAVQGWLFNHEGTRRGEEFVSRKITMAVARIYDELAKGKRPTPLELGNLDAQRDWSDAEDMVDGVWRMLNQEVYNKKLGEEHFEEWYELYNEFENKRQMTEWESKRIKDYVVGSGVKHTIREFVAKAFLTGGIQGKWMGNGMYEIFGNEQYGVLVKINPKFYRPAEVNTLTADPTKIKQELGWSPKTTFDGLIDKMVRNDLTLYTKGV